MGQNGTLSEQEPTSAAYYILFLAMRTVVILLQTWFMSTVLHSSRGLTLPPHRNTVDTLSRIRAEEPYCYSNDNAPNLLFGSLTAYEYIRGDVTKVSVPKKCKPLLFWALNRHGTRYPSKREIQDFMDLKELLGKVKKNFEEGRGSLCTDDYVLLQSWSWNCTIDEYMAKHLAPQGYADYEGIGKRFKQAYPTLFGKKYPDDYYYFQHTDTERTKSSFKSYIRGLFGDHSGIKAKVSDKIIKEYEHCNKWIKEIKASKATDREYNKFTSTPVYIALRKRVSKRLGFKNTVLDVSTIKNMYLDCAFEKAWYVEKQSKWCAAFTKEDLKLLEYGGDLLTYYKNGYGTEYSPKLGCVILRDLYERIDKRVKGVDDKQQVVTAYFTHSTAFDQFITALGLHKDYVPPTGTNYNEEQNRKWRVSEFGAFATNFAVVLHECEDTENKYNLQILIDESPLDPKTGGFYRWDTFKNTFRPTVEACSLEFCDKSN